MKFVHKPTVIDARYNEETGHWIITYPSGCLHIMSPDQFEKCYEPIGEVDRVKDYDAQVVSHIVEDQVKDVIYKLDKMLRGLKQSFPHLFI